MPHRYAQVGVSLEDSATPYYWHPDNRQRLQWMLLILFAGVGTSLAFKFSTGFLWQISLLPGIYASLIFSAVYLVLRYKRIALIFPVIVAASFLGYGSTFLVLSYAPSPPAVTEPELACPVDMPEMEAVWTWVNTTDTVWRAEAEKHGCKVDSSGYGDRDPFESLKYSMRSVSKNMPWIKSFIILTAIETQFPSWLLRDFPGVKVVNHEAFFPPNTAPAFNSQPVEYSVSFLHSRGIVKHRCFLYLNDDFLINQPLEISDFIDPEGRVLMYAYVQKKIGDSNTPIDVPFGLLDRSSESPLVDPHIPYLINSRIAEDMMKNCSFCDKMFQKKCTRSGSFFASHYHKFIMNMPGFWREVSPWDGLFNRCGIGLEQISLEANFRLLNWLNPKFVFIESHNSVENRPGGLEMIKKYLDSEFPDPAPWEI